MLSLPAHPAMKIKNFHSKPTIILILPAGMPHGHPTVHKTKAGAVYDRS